jgi:hypothetical protein
MHPFGIWHSSLPLWGSYTIAVFIIFLPGNAGVLFSPKNYYDKQ